MNTSAVWFKPQHSPDDLQGRTLEIDILTENGPFRGTGGMVVEHSHDKPEEVCIWVIFPGAPHLPQKVALDIIDENLIVPHPDPAKVDYLCAGKYSVR